MIALSDAVVEPKVLGWQDAVATLAAERTRAVSDAKRVIRSDEPALLAEGERLYNEGKAESDGVIVGLKVVLVGGGRPASLADLTGRLRRGLECRQALSQLALKAVPPQIGERGDWAGVPESLLKSLIDPLVKAVSALYQDYRADKALRRETIANALDAARWPTFAEIPQL